ncbi:uncharacterized protein [Typha latifolia]|uniref:uncharacterized protein n=1 Tax=Typha latifolia TaxID=4733 RepID=UPI003C2C031E
MVSDQEIASCVESLLRHSGDPSSTSSLAGVVRQVEAKLGIDLSHKAGFIRDQIDLLLGPRPPPPPPSQPPQQPHLLFHHQMAQPYPPTQAPPELAYNYPPPLPAAAVVAAYHLQQQLQQPLLRVPAAAPAGRAAATKESASTGTKRRGGPGGLNKVCGVSPELQAIVGESTMPRTQIVKQLWAYIRKNNLQDPNNKRKIICNDELRVVFETDSTDMFKMNKLLAKHILPLDPKDGAPDSKKLKPADVDAETKLDVGQHPVVISDALAKFIGAEKTEMPQADALKHVLDYIKANQLEDASSNSILCDSKLQELFGCESCSASTVSQMLAQHFIEKS